MLKQPEVINLTSVPVTIITPTGDITHEPSGQLAHVKETLGREWERGNWPFPIREPTSYGEVVGLPFRKPEPTVDELAGPTGPPDCIYIVPLLVAQKPRADWMAALSGPMPEEGERWYELMLKRFRRDDVFSPGEMVRDDGGRIIGARNLVAVFPQDSTWKSADTNSAIAAAWQQARERAGYDLISVAFQLRKLKDLPADSIPAHVAASVTLAASAFLGSGGSCVSSPTWPSVVEFAFEMERQLDANRHRGDRPGWMSVTAENLWQGAAHNLDELEAELASLGNVGTYDTNTALPVQRAILRRCANLANFAMMIADRTGAIGLAETLPGPEEQAAMVERRQADLLAAVSPATARTPPWEDTVTMEEMAKKQGHLKDGDDPSRSE